MITKKKANKVTIKTKYFSLGFIKEFKDKGRGVAARVNIKKGEIVEVAPVIKIPKEEYPFVSETILAYYLFATEADEDLSVLGLGNSSLYNHSDTKANVKFLVSEKAIIMKATENIKAGQELLIDYCWDKEHTKDFI